MFNGTIHESVMDCPEIDIFSKKWACTYGRRVKALPLLENLYKGMLNLESVVLVLCFDAFNGIMLLELTDDSTGEALSVQRKNTVWRHREAAKRPFKPETAVSHSNYAHAQSVW